MARDPGSVPCVHCRLLELALLEEAQGGVLDQMLIVSIAVFSLDMCAVEGSIVLFAVVLPGGVP